MGESIGKSPLLVKGKGAIIYMLVRQDYEGKVADKALEHRSGKTVTPALH